MLKLHILFNPSRPNSYRREHLQVEYHSKLVNKPDIWASVPEGCSVFNFNVSMSSFIVTISSESIE